MCSFFFVGSRLSVHVYLSHIHRPHPPIPPSSQHSTHTPFLLAQKNCHRGSIPRLAKEELRSFARTSASHLQHSKCDLHRRGRLCSGIVLSILILPSHPSVHTRPTRAIASLSFASHYPPPPPPPPTTSTGLIQPVQFAFAQPLPAAPPSFLPSIHFICGVCITQGGFFALLLSFPPPQSGSGGASDS